MINGKPSHLVGPAREGGGCLGTRGTKDGYGRPRAREGREGGDKKSERYHSEGVRMVSWQTISRETGRDAKTIAKWVKLAGAKEKKSPSTAVWRIGRGAVPGEHHKGAGGLS
jgi:hypothetical protein